MAGGLKFEPLYPPSGYATADRRPCAVHGSWVGVGFRMSEWCSIRRKSLIRPRLHDTSLFRHLWRWRHRWGGVPVGEWNRRRASLLRAFDVESYYAWASSQWTAGLFNHWAAGVAVVNCSVSSHSFSLSLSLSLSFCLSCCHVSQGRYTLPVRAVRTDRTYGS